MKNNSLLIIATMFIGRQSCLVGCSGKTSSDNGFANDTIPQTSLETITHNKSQNALGDFVTASRTITPSVVHIKTIYEGSETSGNSGQSNPDYWAIHPGGVGIVEAVKQSLNLCTSDVEDSLSVLANYGNMSSPTILFVLKRILDKIRLDAVGENKEIFACAFGPGLTIEMIGLSAINMVVKKELLDSHYNYAVQDLNRVL
jgi:3-oxoacyl-[acyl-carrier-protein] synthase III